MSQNTNNIQIQVHLQALNATYEGGETESKGDWGIYPSQTLQLQVEAAISESGDANSCLEFPHHLTEEEPRELAS